MNEYQAARARELAYSAREGLLGDEQARLFL